MKHKLYKNVLLLFAIGFLGNISAQKFDKKFTESFTVNKEVEVVINASNAEINVTNWDKNQVFVEAFIEIEGLSKEEAEKYFKNWNFEALGNKSKVRITSLENASSDLRNDFIFHNNIDFKMPDIKMPDFDSIIIPDMDFDFDFDFDFDLDFDFDFNFDDLENDMKKDGDYSFEWEHNGEKISIKSKEEWEAFKKTKKYKELKEKLSFDKQKMKEELAKSKIKMKEGIEKARIQYKKIDKEQIKKELAKAKEQINKMKLNFNSSADDIIIDGKKIKIKKRLEIKVPKAATFNLNTRHCKVKLPNTVAFGKVSYGNFNVANLNGGKLTIDYSKVSIDDLNGCTLFLNNVTDAKIASVTNTVLNNNSSGVYIVLVNKNVEVSNKFSEITIDKFNPIFGKFVFNLSHSEASLPLENINVNMKIETKNSKFLYPNKKNHNILSRMLNRIIEKENSISEGQISLGNKTNNTINLTANYSTINVIE